MAPARTSNRRAQRDQNTNPALLNNVQSHQSVEQEKDDLFLEPMMGTPLALYVDKDVEGREQIVELITDNGGVVSPGYSGVPYILVDPHKESGQNLYRQYAGKKGKIVLSANWVVECIKAGELQTYQHNWAGCKVTGSEIVSAPVDPTPSTQVPPPPIPSVLPAEMVQAVTPAAMIQSQSHPLPMQQPQLTATPADTLVHHPQAAYPYTVYHEIDPSRAIHPAAAAPPQTWQATNGIAPQQTHIAPPPHMMPRHTHAYREDQTWPGGYQQQQPQQAATMVGEVPPAYDFRYRDDQNWVTTAGQYYDQQYDQTYAQPEQPYMEQPGPSNAESSAMGAATNSTPPAEPQRGRKRTRTQPQPAPPASTLVVNRRNPPARSPTPPTRVLKSTYGGNLFTADDILYLKKYIDYCQEQGLVLSLREICERIAVKAPHHTFYSWRRYCNKHQIRLGGYTMDTGEGGTPQPGEEQEPPQPPATGVGPTTIATARRAAEADVNRDRSPTPPRALFRSTTGKGVAFTDEDVTFLVRFLEYRNRTQSGKVDMVAFWKDVANKAPHHSRASWMKFYRRHKHELNHSDADAPLPPPPDKKMRYSRGDDVLLAKFFVNKPEGTSDKIFQNFAREQPHHPWKGWQEHHRIHKAKIDHLIARLGNGEDIDDEAQE